MRWALKLLVVWMALVAGVASAQDADAPAEGEDDNGFIINLLQDQLSTDSRKIRLSGVDGVLSSEATVARITISDPDGIWLQIDNARIVWSRSALLRGRVEVETLAAERIDIRRPPLPEPGLPDPGAGGPFQVPELPVSVTLDQLAVETIALGEPVAGIAAEFAAEGKLKIADGALDAAFSLDRLDGPGGAFELAASFDNADGAVALDLALSEPQGGVAATLLGLDGAPPLETGIVATGTLDALDATIDFKVDGADLIDGRVRVRAADAGTNFALGVTGRLRPLLPPEFYDFFAERSDLAVQGQLREDGGLDIRRLDIESGGLSIDARASLAADRFPDAIEMTARLASPDGVPLVLPFGDGSSTIESGQFRLSFGGSEEWLGFVQVSELAMGDVTFGDVSARLGGVIENAAVPETRRVTAEVDGAIAQISAIDPAVQQALGERISLALGLDWRAGVPLRIETARIEGRGVEVDLVGTLDGGTFSGRAALELDELASFAGVAARDLRGAVQTSVSGTLNPVTGVFALALDGSAEDLALDVTQLDPLLDGTTRLSGLIARDEAGIRAENFALASDAAEITADGIYAAEGTDFRASARVVDVGLVTEEAAGPAALQLVATGGVDELNVDAELAMLEGTFRGRAVRDARFRVVASGETAADLGGRVRGSAEIGAVPIRLGGDFAIDDEVQRLREFVLTAGRSRFDGTVARGADGLIAGTVNIASPDIGEVAGLVRAEAAGAADLRLVLSRSVGRQRAQLIGRVEALEVPQGRLGAADADITLTDVFNIPLIGGTLSARDASFGEFRLARLDLNAEVIEQRSAFDLEAALEDGTEAALNGAISNLDPGFLVALDGLRLQTVSASVDLEAPAALRVVGDEVSLTPLDLSVGDGRLRLGGRYGPEIDLEVLLQSIPLDVANDIVPGLEAQGRVSGDARITGSSDAPAVDFSLEAAEVTAAAIADLGLPPVTLRAEGVTEASVLELDANLSAGADLTATARGSVPLVAEVEGLAAEIVVERLALSMLDRLAGSQGLVGTATARAEVSGSLSDPLVAFNATVDGLSARVLRGNGIGPLRVAAQGRFADQQIDLEQATLDGSGGVRLSAAGRVPLSGGGLDVSATGQLPVSLANVALARSQAQASGAVDLTLAARGALSAPQLSGSARLRDGVFSSPPLNLRLDQIVADVRLADERVVIENASAAIAAGGRITLDGSLGIGPGSGYPADLRLQIRDGVYSDGAIFTTRIESDLALTGPVLNGGLVSGRVDVRETEVTIPSSFGINAGVLLDIDHLNPPRDVVLTLDRAGLGQEDGAESGGPPVAIGLDVAVNVPNQLFIRGRGLDAELGGRIVLQGTTRDIVPVGAIDLIRGRINILGQRIDFNEGAVTLLGTFDPVIRLVAQTTSGDGTLISIVVSGVASDPEITFEASPELPQDEVLALLIFDRNVSELSPFQIAQLAAAAATLSGRGGGGLVEGLRGATGLANLDITSGDDGAVGVRAGAYIDENIYLDVEADSAGDSKATINLDITDTLTGRVSVDNNGQGTLGLFFERDY